MTPADPHDHGEDGHARAAGGPVGGPGTVRVQYWAAARAAAGTEHDDLPVDGAVSLADVRDAVLERHPDDRMRRVLGVCSVLVGDRPAGAGDPADVRVEPGEHVQFLPPFAGG